MNEIKKHEKALILSGGGARGAYQVGVLKFLNEYGWQPDLICGTSVGALNAVGMGSGLSVADLENLWKDINSGKVYRISIFKKLINFFKRKGYTAIMDTKPLRALLEEMVDIKTLRKSEAEIMLATVNIITSELKFFNNSQITVDHIMASSAIPGLFPWQYLDGEPYWDGGMMANTPILPALESGCKEIIVILLSPVGGFQLPLPTTYKKVMERVYEHTMLASYQTIMAHITREKRIKAGYNLIQSITHRGILVGDTKIVTVAPKKMLGFSSMLNFSKEQSHNLIEQGYEDAKQQLAEHFNITL